MYLRKIVKPLDNKSIRVCRCVRVHPNTTLSLGRFPLENENGFSDKVVPE